MMKKKEDEEEGSSYQLSEGSGISKKSLPRASLSTPSFPPPVKGANEIKMIIALGGFKPESHYTTTITYSLRRQR